MSLSVQGKWFPRSAWPEPARPGLQKGSLADTGGTGSHRLLDAGEGLGCCPGTLGSHGGLEQRRSALGIERPLWGHTGTDWTPRVQAGEDKAVLRSRGGGGGDELERVRGQRVGDGTRG